MMSDPSGEQAEVEGLPFVDEQSAVIDVGCADAHASGPRPLEVNSTFPGFRVTRIEPRSALVLTGRHASRRTR